MTWKLASYAESHSINASLAWHSVLGVHVNILVTLLWFLSPSARHCSSQLASSIWSQRKCRFRDERKEVDHPPLNKFQKHYTFLPGSWLSSNVISILTFQVLCCPSWHQFKKLCLMYWMTIIMMLITKRATLTEHLGCARHCAKCLLVLVLY